MSKRNILIAFILLTAGIAQAEDLPKDSLKVVDIEEVVIIATPKENRKLREQPTSVTLLSQQDMQANQVNSVKNLTALVPNIFIPDYGSKLTTSIYIRGIGSRINTPSVGLYVDNIPYIDKSAFDFNYSDIERIDVLRGPQGTLYGRNTMGGLIKVHTKSPFTYQGTDLKLGAATYNDYNVSLTHYHRMSQRFAFSTGGFYEHTGGFFKNTFNNKRIDRSNAGGGRFRGIYLPTENLKVDLTLSYEYSDQGGYPYVYTGMVNNQTETRPDYIGKISYNDPSSYYRGLLNTGVNIEYQARNFTLSAITGYQNLKDRMFLDQDFTELNVFNITQKQKSNTLSEEIVLKSKANKRWQWATGVFGLYQWLDTDGPVTFKKDGMDNMEQGINKMFPSNIPGTMGLDMPDQMLISGRFNTPVLSAAVYHQSTFKDLFTKGLSATIGLRLDYEKNTMKYNSGAEVPSTFKLNMQMGPTATFDITQPVMTHTYFEGKLSNDYLQLLPKFALQYDFNTRNNIYASVSKGYRSGGYNIQMFSDLLQNNLSNDMQSDLKKLLLARPDLKESIKTMIANNLNPGENITDVRQYTLYKPEFSWNYEIGSHLTLCEGKLWLDLAAFYMDTRNQQVSKFAESGLGRITENAGRSRSYGGEASLRASLTNSLNINASYGYTYATFTDYITNQKVGKEFVDIDYTGKYVPFVPKHTMSVGGQYIFFISTGHWLDKVQLNANYTGAGRIFWTEQNNVSQAFYGTLNGCLTLAKGNGAITFWIRNALDKDYAAFYFETMNKGFMQKGRPMQAGIEVRCRF